MKNFSVLIFFFVVSIVSIHSTRENAPLPPWFFTTQKLKLKSRHLTKLPRLARRQMNYADLSNLIYWKHLLELECFKEICNRIHYKNRSRYQRPFEMIRYQQMPAFRNDGTNQRGQSLNLFKMNDNRFNVNPEVKKKYLGNEKIIYWPTAMNFTRKHVNNFSNKSHYPDETAPSKKFEANSKESLELKDYTNQQENYKRPLGFQKPTPDGEGALENSKAFLEEEDLVRLSPGDDAFSKLFQKPSNVRTSTQDYSQYVSQDFRQRENPNQIQPYEVEELIEENFQVDVDSDKDDHGFKTFSGKEVFGKEIRDNKMTKTSSGEVNKKAEHFQNVISDSVNTILKGLISPMMRVEGSTNKEVLETVFPRKNLENGRPSNEINSYTAPYTLTPFTNSFFTEATEENIFNPPRSFQQTLLRLNKSQSTPKSHDRHSYWRQIAPEATNEYDKSTFKSEARKDDSRGLNFTPPFEKEHFKSFIVTDLPKQPSATEGYEQSLFDVHNVEEFHRSHVVEDSGKTVMPIVKNKLELLPTETLRSWDLLRHLNAGHQLNPSSSEKISESSTFYEVLEQASNSSIPLLVPSNFVSHTDKEILITETKAEDSSKDLDPILSETNATLTTQDFVETVKYIPETNRHEEITKRDFLEFTDHPVSFDLLATTKLDFKKDEETIWKNSRKMHFGQEHRKTTLFSGITEDDGIEQRRSDILITENLTDYVDDENNLSTLSYLEKLKQNNSFLSLDRQSLTSDVLIPLIPVIINDLREHKISPNDVLILSEALRKYWKPILALSNFTNLDMLPLLKMKDEKDLENVLENFLPEDLTTARTTESDYKSDDDYSESYDYMDEYKDLYKDILGQELGYKKKRFRPRRDAEDDLKKLEATREYFESIEEEEQERKDEEGHDEEGNDYIFEDIMYDEVSDGEDSSVFELMEVSDVHIEKET